MEELIFIAIIIFFSIIDSIARKKKKRQGQMPGPTSPAPGEWEWEDEEPATYDADASYDGRYEVEEAKAEPPPRYTRPYGSSTGTSREEPRSSEGMVPADIWEEIAGLTRGKAREPEPPPPAPVEVEPIPPRPVGRHRVHRAHLEYGTDPSTRRRSEQDEIDPLRVRLSRDAAAVRRQLRSHRRHALRRAVILHEILGPPAATRPERFEQTLGG